ncbi:5-oxoprolinase-like isoform X2 [Oscarella lobularis]|uniref:5-oxoprolinase-like isoform X2 n=1 Tax=Oscarella lobularis TaxID=121494 RepID=UPI003313442A
MFRFAIDRGGTFTDVYAECPSGRVRVMKLLSEDPSNYVDAPREAIRRIMQEDLDRSMPKEEPLDTSQIEWIRMGTTVATNALLERKGERMALFITKGFKDLLHIGNQARPNIFDLEIVCPDVLYENVVEVEERVVLVQDKCQLDWDGKAVEEGVTGEEVNVMTSLNLEKLKQDLAECLDSGIQSLAVVLMHSYTFTRHEHEIATLAISMGFRHVSLSSEVMPMVRIVPRGFTACADAYLTPCIRKYIDGFQNGFDESIKDTQVLFMQSDGGLTSVGNFSGSRAILSGPAGGVVGYSMTAYNSQTDKKPAIGFDMGGTSTDVSRFAGDFEHVFETTTAGVSIQAPQLDINTVAAGGGSRLFFRAGLFVVGPESAGAHPGPVCYRKGGPLTVTDANLVLGRLLPEYFPCIFGPDEDQPLDKEAAETAFDELTAQVNTFLADQEEKRHMSREEVAMGFLDVANETMCRPIRALTQGKGYDTSAHVLACFGGAGGQHACAIARSLGMQTVHVHRYAGILSAYGLALADVVEECQEPCAKLYEEASLDYLDARIDALTEKAASKLKKQGFQGNDIVSTPYLHLRYHGTDCALMCTPVPSSKTTSKYGDFLTSFTNRYWQEFGFVLTGRSVHVDDIRVRATGRCHIAKSPSAPKQPQSQKAEKIVSCYFDNKFWDTEVYALDQLGAGHTISGPAILIEQNSTIVVEPGCESTITESGSVEIRVEKTSMKKVDCQLDTIQLSIFSHRFMSIAEQMGRVLRRTSISTNIKERLDFSCALFGADGGLVANAPHIPVHLGAMQEAVQWQLLNFEEEIRDGDVILTNHPAAGGSHLPDLTVITPVFWPNVSKPVFFVACRGHHADIGGTTPGSMPPHSTALWEEGMAVKSFKLVDSGRFQEAGVSELLMEPGKRPNSSGTRNLQDNLSDLKAQVAANNKGISLVKELIGEYGLDVVQAYMQHIQDNAEVAVREMLKKIASKEKLRSGTTTLSAIDHMDDGSPISLTIAIDESEGTALFDFTDTGKEVQGNWNAPRAVTFSAMIYCLRCMVGYDVPLNQGCLRPIKTILPEGCLLDPSDTAAVIGGNVLTSQRIVDVIFKAFETCAASQGCMNNTTFGDESFGYYETVAGGAGAGSSWHGRSGVHCHMTNTRITDPEILEQRYPVVLKRFELNNGSGGGGQYRGGDGVVREMIFRRAQTLCILSERRGEYKPYGMHGGEPGSVGENWIIRKDGQKERLGSKSKAQLFPGDSFLLKTPGGGGYGREDELCQYPSPSKRSRQMAMQSGSVAEYKRMQESA